MFDGDEKGQTGAREGKRRKPVAVGIANERGRPRKNLSLIFFEERGEYEKYLEIWSYQY